MKKLIIILPFALLACKKESPASPVIPQDSAAVATPAPKVQDSARLRDSLRNNSPATKAVLREGVMRKVDAKTITREADAAQLPFTIGEEFTESGQEFILKLKHVPAGKISVFVKPENPKQNIRISQIVLEDGAADGPFGRELKNYVVPESGEISLRIGRSNMASGEEKGAFSVLVE